jgi:protein SCO1/2
MRAKKLFILLLIALPAALCVRAEEIIVTHTEEPADTRTFAAKGVVMEIPDTRTIVIKHEAISNYMAAMTMPFKVRDEQELWGLHPGDTISFQLKVTTNESWVDVISKTGTSTNAPPVKKLSGSPPAVSALPGHPLLNYKFTNELGQAVSLNDFRGQALGLTFFYTRCPLPEYCPRLSKNFQEACRLIAAATNAPSNWHFVSISFDTEFDTPEMLRAYGRLYGYDPAHWSFLTGPKDKVAELAKLCGMQIEPDGYTFNHNFRTLIIDAAGHLQMIFPFTGDFSDNIAAEMLKAAAVTNPPAQIQR